MKSQPIQISIPKPCHENWEAMTAVERGRFCNSCQKVVTDFTQMEDAEIIRYFQEGKNLCGRFANEQLNRPLIEAAQKPRYFITPLYKKIAAGLLFTVGFLHESFAQQKKQNTTQQPVSATEKSKAPIIISGHLLDMETQKPLEGMSVFLQNDGFELQVKTTNRWGGFTFSVPVNQQNGKGTLSVDVSTTKYKAISMQVPLMKTNTLVKLFCTTIDTQKKVVVSRGLQIGGERQLVTMGGPMGDYPINELINLKVKKRSFWYRITHPFKKKK